MKIVIAGDWHSDLHEEPVERALRQLGHDTVRFPWFSYFVAEGAMAALSRPLLKVQNKYLAGPLVTRLNRDLFACVQEAAPDAVLMYRGSHVYGETLRRIRALRRPPLVVGYNNDDPFSPSYPRWFWRHFLTGLPAYDLLLAYRPHNIAEYRAAGAREVRLLRSWYVPERNRPVALSDQDRGRFECDVVFAGHYEDDGRLECLEAVARRGWKLNIFGHDYGWHPALRQSPVLRRYMPLRTVWGEDYNKALCGARVALCFLSKLNRDTYTRRSFEIPASGTLMLAQHADDLASLFKAGEEADYFHGPGELVQKLELYLGDEALRRRVAEAGRRRVQADGHDIVSRMRQLSKWMEELRATAKMEAACAP